MKNIKKFKKLFFLITVLTPQFSYANPTNSFKESTLYGTISELDLKQDDSKGTKKRGSSKKSSKRPSPHSTEKSASSDASLRDSNIIIIDPAQLTGQKDNKPQTFVFSVVIRSNDNLNAAPFEITASIPTVKKLYQEDKKRASSKSMPDKLKPMPQIKPLDLSRILAAREKEQAKTLNVRSRPLSADSLQNMFLKGIVDSLDQLVVKNALIVFDENLEATDFTDIQARINHEDILGHLENALVHLESHPTLLGEMLDRKDLFAFKETVQKFKANKDRLAKKLSQPSVDPLTLKRSLEREINAAIFLLKVLSTKLTLQSAIQSKVLNLYTQLTTEQNENLFEEAAA